MIRALWFLFIVTLGVFALVWLLDRPGSVVLDWQGYRAETSIAVLFGLVSTNPPIGTGEYYAGKNI